MPASGIKTGTVYGMRLYATRKRTLPPGCKPLVKNGGGGVASRRNFYCATVPQCGEYET